MISVIMPTYNRENTIKRAIDSVLNQTYRNIELIIVDDYSTDNTEKIISEIKDKRLKYIKLKKNSGACHARNVGLDNAKGEYIAFQDSDDEWIKDKLDKQIKMLIDNKVDMVFCSAKHIGKNEIIIPREKLDEQQIKNRIFKSNFISTQTILATKKCFEHVRFDEKMPRFQDWDLIIRMLEYFSIIHINEPLVNVYIQSDSISKSKDKAIKALEMMLNKYQTELKKFTELQKAYLYEQIAMFKIISGKEGKKELEEAFKREKNNKTKVKYYLSKFHLEKILKIYYERYER